MISTIHDENVARIVAPLNRVADALDPSGLPLSRLIPKGVGALISRGLFGFVFGVGFWLAANVVGR